MAILKFFWKIIEWCLGLIGFHPFWKREFWDEEYRKQRQIEKLRERWHK